MKLLDKREVDVAKAAERRMEIEEGKKLAVRVDKLRELFASEQGSLAKYRDETVKQALAEVEKILEKIAAVNAELQTAQNARDAALKPVDALLENARAIEKEAKGLFAEANRLLDEGNARIAEAKLGEEAAREAIEIANREIPATKRTSEVALRLEKAAREKLREAEKFLKDSTAQAVATAKAAEVRDTESKAREAAVIKAESQVAHDREALGMRERAIIDREEMLARGEARLKK